jgi:hypothetical protein
MVKINFDSKPKTSKKDLIGFAKEQFRQILRRNLNIPIKLFHL